MATQLSLNRRGYLGSHVEDRPALLGYALIVALVAIGLLIYAVGASGLGARSTSVVIGEVLGIIAAILLALTAILAVRLRPLERLFGDMTKVYVAHGIVGLTMFGVVTLHPLLYVLGALPHTDAAAGIIVPFKLVVLDWISWITIALALVPTLFVRLPFDLALHAPVPRRGARRHVGQPHDHQRDVRHVQGPGAAHLPDGPVRRRDRLGRVHRRAPAHGRAQARVPRGRRRASPRRPRDRAAPGARGQGAAPPARTVHLRRPGRRPHPGQARLRGAPVLGLQRARQRAAPRDRRGPGRDDADDTGHHRRRRGARPGARRVRPPVVRRGRPAQAAVARRRRRGDAVPGHGRGARRASRRA